MRILQIFDCDDEVKKPRIFWFLVLGCIWMYWIIQKGNEAYDKAATELAANQSSGHVYSEAAIEDCINKGGISRCCRVGAQLID